MSSNPLNESQRTVLLFSNPRAGARSNEEKLAALVKELQRREYRVERCTDPDSLGDVAAQFTEAGELRAIVSAGGDGTANLIAQLVPASVPLIPFPLGTENLISKYLGYTASPVQLGEALDGGWTKAFDAGSCNGHLFLLMVGCGFDAQVVQRLHATRKGHINHLSYASPILRTLWDYPFPELQLKYLTKDDDDNSWQERSARWAFVINLPRYAAGLSFVPTARGTDGLLDLCTFKDGTVLKGLYYLTNLMLGKHENLDDCVMTRVRRVRIEANSPEVPYQYDGDPGGILPIDISVLPRRLTFVLTPQWQDPADSA